jgi:hypothetical protein
MKIQTKPPEILTRLIIAALQSKGRLGKSWLILLLVAWLDRHVINWLGFDLDDAHRSFSTRYPDVKALTVADEISGRDELLKVFRAALAGKAPVIPADTRAQLAPFLLDTIERTKFLHLAGEKSVRMTALVFAADDDDSLHALIEGLQRTGTAIDYLVVRNPALFGSRRYDGSPLQKTLLAAGAAEITLPVLMESTRRAIARAEAESGKLLSFPDALEHLKDFSKGDLEYFLAASFAQFDNVAHLLLPTELATTIKPQQNLASVAKHSMGALSINLGDE